MSVHRIIKHTDRHLLVCADVCVCLCARMQHTNLALAGSMLTGCRSSCPVSRRTLRFALKIWFVHVVSCWFPGRAFVPASRFGTSLSDSVTHLLMRGTVTNYKLRWRFSHRRVKCVCALDNPGWIECVKITLRHLSVLLFCADKAKAGNFPCHIQTQHKS